MRPRGTAPGTDEVRAEGAASATEIGDEMNNVWAPAIDEGKHETRKGKPAVQAKGHFSLQARVEGDAEHSRRLGIYQASERGREMVTEGTPRAE